VLRVTRAMHLRRLRQQPLRTGIAMLGVAAGVAITAGVLVARSSMTGAIADFSQSISGSAALRVEGSVDRDGVDAAALPRIAAAEGVEAAVPLVLAITVAVDRNGDERFVSALGVDCSFEAIVGSFGCDPTALADLEHRDAALISQRLAAALGQGGVLRSDVRDVPASNALVIPQLDALGDGNVTLWPLASAKDLFGRPHGYDAVLVVPEPGIDRTRLAAAVSEAAGPTNVVRAADEPIDDEDVVGQLLIGLLLASLIGLTVGGQLVHNTLSLSFEERRRELAVMAAVGATPRRVARGVLAEAALIGACGGVLGALLGAMLIARSFVDALSSQIGRTTGVRVGVDLSASAVALAVAVGVGAAVVAAIGPARRAASLDLAAELAERPRHERRSFRRDLVAFAVYAVGTVGGLTLGWAGSRNGAIETWQPAAVLAGLILAPSCAFRLPGTLAPISVRLLAPRIPERAPIARVALANLDGDPPRTRAIALALGGAISLAVTLGGIVPAVAQGGRDMAAAGGGGRVTVSGIPINNGDRVETKVSPADEASIRALPGVATIEHTYDAELTHPTFEGVYLGAEEGRTTRYDLYLGGDPEAAIDAGHAVIGPGLARDRGLEVGDRFMVPGRDGPVPLVVGGVWAAPDGRGHNITVSLPVFESIAGSRPASTIRVVPEPGVRVDELADRIRAADLRAGMRIVDPAQLEDEFAVEFRAFTDPFLALQRGLLIVAFTATMSTLLLAGVQRRREHATLTAVGMPPAKLAAMTVAEAAVVSVLATVLGAIAGVAGGLSFAWASGVLTGMPISIDWPWTVVPVAGGAATLVAIAGASFPAWRTSRVDPALALRYE
jgi:putative ABC transport system permease protein